MPEMMNYPAQMNRYDFQPAWQEARACCEKLLRWPLHTELRGNELLAFQSSCYAKIYKLVSSPASNVPSLVKNDNEQVSAPDPEGTQVLVLYYLLRELLKTHLDHGVRPALQQEKILETYTEEWRKYSVGLDLVASAFRFLHSHWSKKALPPGHVTMSTRQLGLTLWGDHIVGANREALSRTILQAVQQDRSHSSSVSLGLVKNVLVTFDQLCSHDPRRHVVYSDVFEAPLLNDLKSAYSAKAQSVLGAESNPNSDSSVSPLMVGGLDAKTLLYLDEANKWYADECARFDTVAASSRSVLPQNARRQLTIALVEDPLPMNKLVQAFEQSIGRTEIEAIEVTKKIFRLALGSDHLVQRMCEKIDGLILSRLSRELASRKQEIECEIGASQSADVTKGSPLLDAVLATYRPFAAAFATFDQIARNPVQPNPDVNGSKPNKFRAAIGTALKAAIAAQKESLSMPIQTGRFSESLARYCNSILRPKSQGLQADADEAMLLAEAVELLEFIFDRDVFATCYQHFLSQRLISGVSSTDNEEKAINAFRRTWGREFTYKWERMYNDATAVRDRYKEMSAQLEHNSTSTTDFELYPLILTAAWWPINIDEQPMIISGEVGRRLRAFEELYNRDQGHRTLKWSLQHSNATVNCQFGANVYTFTVSPYQWEILQLFNEKLSEAEASSRQANSGGPLLVSFAEIQKRTAQSTELLQRALFALINNKLLISSHHTDIAQHTYHVNTKFSNPRRKMQFLYTALSRRGDGADGAAGGVGGAGGDNSGSAGASAGTSLSSKAMQQALNERRFAIQAAIVRSVKSRKTATYAQIVGDVETTLARHHIEIQSKDIKVNLELMIEKEYVERSPEDPSLFLYLA